MANQSGRARAQVTFMVTAKPDMEAEAKTARIEITKATWGSKTFTLGQPVEVDDADASWFQSQYSIGRSGPTMPLYLLKVEVQPEAQAPEEATESAPPSRRKGR